MRKMGSKKEKEGGFLSEIQVCNSCDRPHWGYSDRNKRCLCDTSFNYHYEVFVVDKNGNILSKYLAK